MDMSQYRDLFLTEAREHLHNLNDLIGLLESGNRDQENINALFRSAHSLKGMAASMEYNDIAELAHRMEDLMDKVRQGALSFEGGIADLLLEGADLVPEGEDVALLGGKIDLRLDLIERHEQTSAASDRCA